MEDLPQPPTASCMSAVAPVFLSLSLMVCLKQWVVLSIPSFRIHLLSVAEALSALHFPPLMYRGKA